jgi:hypothetical protein
MRVVYSVIALVFLGSGFVCGQNQSTRMPATQSSSIFSTYPNLEAQASEYGDAFVRKDYQRLVELTYPKYIENAGGKQSLITVAAGTGRGLEADGVRVLSWMPTEVSQLVDESGSLYAVVPMTRKMKARTVLLESYDCLIGISIDQGEHWTFVSSSCVNLKDAFPEVAERLILCPEKQSVTLARP